MALECQHPCHFLCPRCQTSASLVQLLLILVVLSQDTVEERVLALALRKVLQ